MAQAAHVVIWALAAACVADADGLRRRRATGTTGTQRVELIGESLGRPARVTLPHDYDDGSQRAWPVVVVLHGFGSNGDYHDFYMGVSAHSSSLGFIAIAAPNGTVNSQGNRFWNAIGCCDYEESGVNDRAYLRALIEEARSSYSIDKARVYAMGHTNGGLMAQVAACQVSDVFTGMVGLSPGFIPAKCWESKAAKVLTVLGSEDAYLTPCIAAYNMEVWAGYLGCCKNATHTGERRDYDCEPNVAFDYDSHYDRWKDKNCALPGPETRVSEWVGCGENKRGKMGLWVMEGATHNPALNSAWHTMRSPSCSTTEAASSIVVSTCGCLAVSWGGVTEDDTD